MQKAMFEVNASEKNMSQCCSFDIRHFYVQFQNDNRQIYVNETEDCDLVKNILGGESTITTSLSRQNP